MVEYIKMMKSGLVVLGIWMVIFLTVFLLSAIPLHMIAYGFLLFAVLGGIYMIWDFQKFVMRRKMLTEVKRNVSVTLEGMPEAENPMEAQYQELLRELFLERVRLESEYTRRQADMVDYYTMWAHQVKTPLAAMRLLLQTEEIAQEQELEEQLFKTEEYVGMVLQYLRIGDMGADLKIRQYSLDGIVRQAVRKYSKSFIRKHLCLVYEELDCTVVTDEKWLLFVVEQILSNAVKYTKTGTISIFMDKENPQTLVIEDTGMGIAEEDLPRIFEKGFTGYNGRRDKKSTGIGLYLCKNILKKLNHTIRITSKEGEGCRVELGLEYAKLEVD